MAKGAKKKETLTPEEKLQQALVPVEEQPYPLLINWLWCKLSSICEFERGITFPASAKEIEKADNNIPCLRTANIQDNLVTDDLIYVDKSFIKGNVLKYARINDIIMSSANSRELVGKVCYVSYLPCPMTFGGFVLIIRTKHIISKYLFYYLRFEFLMGKFMGKSTQTTNIANINTTKLSEYVFPLPPLPEQQRIVARIESLFAKLDEVKEKAQAVVDGYEDRKAAILHKAFTGELTAKWREEKGISLDSWRKKKIGEFSFVTKLAGFEYTKYIAPNLTEDGIPLFKGKNVQDGKLVLSFESFIPPEISDELQRSKLNKKCLLTPYVGTIGNIAIFDGSFVAHLGSNVGKIEVNSDTSEEYLLYFLRSDYGYKELTKQKKATAQESISIQAIRDVIVLLPEQLEQEKIVHCLDTLFTKESSIKEAAQSVLDQIDTMKKSILARAFRGELGTNDPADGPAVELLKKVLQEQG